MLKVILISTGERGARRRSLRSRLCKEVRCDLTQGVRGGFSLFRVSGGKRPDKEGNGGAASRAKTSSSLDGLKPDFFLTVFLSRELESRKNGFRLRLEITERSCCCPGDSSGIFETLQESCHSWGYVFRKEEAVAENRCYPHPMFRRRICETVHESGNSPVSDAGQSDNCTRRPPSVCAPHKPCEFWNGGLGLALEGEERPHRGFRTGCSAVRRRRHRLHELFTGEIQGQVSEGIAYAPVPSRRFMLQPLKQVGEPVATNCLDGQRGLNQVWVVTRNAGLIILHHPGAEPFFIVTRLIVAVQGEKNYRPQEQTPQENECSLPPHSSRLA